MWSITHEDLEAIAYIVSEIRDSPHSIILDSHVSEKMSLIAIAVYLWKYTCSTSVLPELLLNEDPSDD